MNYTKGKWTVEVYDDYTNVEAEYQTICTDVSNCDAHLIAQSPRMAKFLENLCAEYEDYGKIDDTFYRRAKDILTKVED